MMAQLDQTSLVALQYKITLLSNKVIVGSRGISLICALKLTTEDIIITSDSDGERKPKEIPALLESLNNGYDVGCRFTIFRS